MGVNLLNPTTFQKRVYDLSPLLVRRLLANLQAWQRDRFRRYGDYQAEVAYYDPSWLIRDPAEQEAQQLQHLNILLEAARKRVSYYRQTLPESPLSRLEDLRSLPILEKEAIRENPLNFVAEGLSPRELWLCSTSGSTGTPLRFYRDRSVTRAHQAVADALMARHGCYLRERRVRFSGASVVPYEKTRPPFWLFIDYYQQLQCSPYHLGPDTYHSYIQAMKDAGVRYGTGYASAWHLLASFLLESGESPPPIKAIFTDSEGISLEQQAAVERAFGCKVFQTYGTAEVGQVAMQCPEKRYHVLTRSSIVEILDEKDRPVKSGENGQVVVTDLTSLVTPFIRYRTGDLATVEPDPCPCGWRSPAWKELVGRIDDRVLTPEGRWIGRLSHVLKPGVGIRESQIIQTKVDRIIIKVVPDHNFDPASMPLVLAAAHRYLGRSMKVSWELVDHLERSPAGKLRHVVRQI